MKKIIVSLAVALMFITTGCKFFDFGSVEGSDATLPSEGGATLPSEGGGQFAGYWELSVAETLSRLSASSSARNFIALLGNAKVTVVEDHTYYHGHLSREAMAATTPDGRWQIGPTDPTIPRASMLVYPNDVSIFRQIRSLLADNKYFKFEFAPTNVNRMALAAYVFQRVGPLPEVKISVPSIPEEPNLITESPDGLMVEEPDNGENDYTGGHDHDGHGLHYHDDTGHDHYSHDHHQHDYTGHDHYSHDHHQHDYTGHDHYSHDHHQHDYTGHDHDGYDYYGYDSGNDYCHHGPTPNGYPTHNDYSASGRWQWTYP